LLLIRNSTLATGKIHFEKSKLVKDGLYVDMPECTEFVKVDKQLSFHAHKSQTQGWRTDNLHIGGRGYIGNKVARGQMGWQFFHTIFKDLVDNCNADTLLINDFMAGVGDAGKAAVLTKVAPETIARGVRVCYWGFEDRRTFAEVCRANIRTTVGEQFISGALQVPGHQVITAPVPRGNIAAATIRIHLKEPLKHLSIATDGSLLIPSLDEIAANPPIEMTEDVRQLLGKLRVEFPRTTPTPTTMTLPKCPVLNSGDDDDDEDENRDAFQCGNTFSCTADLICTLTITNGCILKELDIGGGRKLVLCKINEHTQRVLLTNTSTMLCTLDAGTYIGGGGPGEFVSDECALDKKPHSWEYTRYTDYKKDTAQRANGYFVFGEQASGSDPKLQTLENIETSMGSVLQESTLYGHYVTRCKRFRVAPGKTNITWVPTRSMPQDGSTFSRLSLGQWSHSLESRTAGGLQIEGILRPAFVLRLDGTHLSPSPNREENTVMLFIKTTFMLKPNTFIVL
jgi:hypothetical protein